jgi:O-antigen/teichoic acid export membrane protein
VTPMRDELASIRKQATRAALWRLLDMVGGQTISFVAFTILARLLSPEDFGVVTLAAAIVAIPSILLSEGLGTALVQRDVITDDHIATAFWANLALSLCFVAVMQLVAGWAAQIAGIALLEPVLRCLSVLLIAAAATSIPTALYIRRITYSTLAKRTFVASSGGSIAAIAMAFMGFEVWSLVAMQLCIAVLSTFVMWQGLAWRPKPSFSLAALRDMFHFTSRVMVGNASRYVAGQADALIIGLFLGAKSLGYYYLITRLVMTVAMMTMAPVDSVILPVLSRLSDDPARRAETYSKIVGIGAVLWIPSLSGLGVLAPTLLPLLFGHKWDEAIPMMMIGSLVAVSWSLTWPTVNLLLAVGQAGAFACFNLIDFGITTACFLVGVKFGTTGVACAFVAVSAFLVPISLLFIRNYAQVAPTQVLRPWLPALIASLVMVLFLMCLSAIVTPGIAILASEIIVGIVVYSAVYWALSPSNVNEYIATALQALPRKPAPFIATQRAAMEIISEPAPKHDNV